jgi:hypothetical protein
MPYAIPTMALHIRMYVYRKPKRAAWHLLPGMPSRRAGATCCPACPHAAQPPEPEPEPERVGRGEGGSPTMRPCPPGAWWVSLPAPAAAWWWCVVVRVVVAERVVVVAEQGRGLLDALRSSGALPDSQAPPPLTLGTPLSDPGIPCLRSAVTTSCHLSGVWRVAFRVWRMA